MKDIDKPPVRCTHCGEYFTTRFALTAHIKKIHLPNGKRFGCSIYAPIEK
jgi:hypothetical protein